MSDTEKNDVKTAISTWLNPILTAIVAFFLMQLYAEFKDVRTNVDEMSKTIIKLELTSEIKAKQEESDKKSLEDFHNKLNTEIEQLKKSINKIDNQINERNK